MTLQRDVAYKSPKRLIDMLVETVSRNGNLLLTVLGPSRSLEARKITNVQLLGSSEPLDWRLSSEGLSVACPRRWSSEDAVAFKISFA